MQAHTCDTIGSSVPRLSTSNAPPPRRQTHLPLSRLTNQLYIRPTHAPSLRLTRMLCPIEHENLTRNRLGRYQIRVLWHIPSAVHFPVVVYPLDDLNPGRRRRRGQGMPTELTPLVIII